MDISTLRSKKVILPAVGLLVVAMGAAFAFFTDHVDGRVTLKTDENAVQITTDPGTKYEGKLSQKWADKNTKAIANFNPGDILDLGFTLRNEGSRAIDVRETIFITSSEVLTKSSPEYRMFHDAIRDSAGAWDGIDVVDVEQVDANTVKYSIDPYVLSSARDAIGDAPVERENHYHLIFDKLAPGAFQGSTCTVDLLIEAKQHTSELAPDEGWTNLESASIEFSGKIVDTVPKQ